MAEPGRAPLETCGKPWSVLKKNNYSAYGVLRSHGARPRHAVYQAGAPRVRAPSDDMILKPGMVLTLEPGG